MKRHTKILARLNQIVYSTTGQGLLALRIRLQRKSNSAKRASTSEWTGPISQWLFQNSYTKNSRLWSSVRSIAMKKKKRKEKGFVFSSFFLGYGFVEDKEKWIGNGKGNDYISVLSFFSFKKKERRASVHWIKTVDHQTQDSGKEDRAINGNPRPQLKSQYSLLHLYLQWIQRRKESPHNCPLSAFFLPLSSLAVVY